MLYEIRQTYSPHDAENDRCRERVRFEAGDLNSIRTENMLLSVIRVGLKALGCGDESVKSFMKDIESDNDVYELLDFFEDLGEIEVVGCGDNGDYEWQIVIDPKDEPGKVSLAQETYINKLSSGIRGDHHLRDGLTAIKNPADFERIQDLLRDLLPSDAFWTVAAVCKIVANVGDNHSDFPPDTKREANGSEKQDEASTGGNQET